MFLTDHEIIQQCDSMVDNGLKPMIGPYLRSQIREVNNRRLISFGVSSAGYDVTLGRNVKVFKMPETYDTNLGLPVVDPKRFDDSLLVDAEILVDPDGSEYVILPPRNYILGVTNEWFNIPRDIMVLVLGKSTYARTCSINNVTPVEPGFEGNVVIEIANGCGLPVKIYLNEGIAQFLFARGKECKTSYADRNGKYQGQSGVTLAKV